MKINIIYFTSTGNTFLLAREAKYFFEQNSDYQVRLFDVMTSKYEDVLDCDIIGIFYPVWMSNMPDHLQAFSLRLLEESVKRNLFLIGNCASGTDNSGSFWKKKFEEKGHKILYVDVLQMPSNFNISVLAKNTSEDEMAELKEKAFARLEVICMDISEGRVKNLGKSVTAFICAVQRLFFHMKNKWAYKYLKVIKLKCIKCQLCVRLCPMQNIELDSNGEISFGKNCILCAKCFNYCPSKAILIGRKSENFKKYHRYYCKEVKPILYR